MRFLLSFLFVFVLGIKAEAQIISDDDPVLLEVYYTMHEKNMCLDIENEFVRRGMDRKEAELTISFLKVQIDMLDVKKNVLSCFKHKNINFFHAENRENEIRDCFDEYKELIEAANLRLGNEENVLPKMFVSGFFVPAQISVEGDNNERLLAVMKNVAANLASSRLNVQEQYQNLIRCMSDDDGNIHQDKMENCAVDFQIIFRREIIKAMDDIMPYLELFAQLMVKSQES